MQNSTIKLFTCLFLFALGTRVSAVGSGIGTEQWESDFPILSGKYEVIGRRFESHALFSGVITVEEVKANQFKVTRVIGGKTILGTGTVEFATPDKIPVFRIFFKEEGKQMEGTYLYRPDLDNNGRISGYVYAKGYAGKRPGIEALFAQ